MKIKHPYLLFGVCVALIGITARIIIGSLGHSYDFESYKIVADIIRAGGIVYNETPRYNYGPLWMITVGILDFISQLFSYPNIAFRLIMLGFLTLADFGLFLLFWRKFNLFIASVIFLNPVSIIVTAYISQFENVALFMAFFAIYLFGDRVPNKFERKHYIALVLLGFSILMKHIFFLFPVWMFFRQKGFIEKRLTLVIPLGIFVLGFIPFLPVAFDSIHTNVFGYTSVYNAPLLSIISSDLLELGNLYKYAWYAIIIFFGYLYRNKPLMESALLYTLVLVLFAPSVLFNYFAVIVPAMAVFFNGFFAVVILIVSYLLTLDWGGLNIDFFLDIAPDFLLYQRTSILIYRIPFAFLFVGFLWINKSYIKSAYKKIRLRLSYPPFPDK